MTVIPTPSPGLRRLRVGGLASQWTLLRFCALIYDHESNVGVLLEYISNVIITKV